MNPRIFIAGMLLAGCALEDPLAGIRTDEVITLSADDQTLLADGRSVLVLTARLGDEASPNLPIRFRTEQGRFAGAASPRDLTLTASGREAIVTLVSGQTASERVTVTAETGGFSAPLVLSFGRAYPDALQLTLEDPVLQAVPGASTELNTRLLRSLGQVSEGTRVFFSTQALAGSPELAIVPFADAAGQELQTALTCRSSEAGTVRITAAVALAPGDTLRQSIALVLTP